MLTLSIDAVSEYEEQVAAFLRRASSKAEGEAALGEHSTSLLAQIKDLLPTMQACPAYAGLAFYGRFQASNLKLIRRLATASADSSVAIESIRTAKALRVSAAAKAGWDFLLSNDPDSLWNAIRLNLCRTKKVEPVEEMEEELDEQDSDEEDQDDDN